MSTRRLTAPVDAAVFAVTCPSLLPSLGPGLAPGTHGLALSTVLLWVTVVRRDRLDTGQPAQRISRCCRSRAPPGWPSKCIAGGSVLCVSCRVKWSIRRLIPARSVPAAGSSLIQATGLEQNSRAASSTSPAVLPLCLEAIQIVDASLGLGAPLPLRQAFYKLSSYAQNMLFHAAEVGRMMAALPGERSQQSVAGAMRQLSRRWPQTVVPVPRTVLHEA